MSYIITVSGSTILSESDQLWQLFTWDAQAIEAGHFKSQADMDYTLSECRRRNLPFGLHSPLFSPGNRYGFLYGFLLGEEDAWQELERDLALAKDLGWSYVLIHFPYLLAGTDPEDGRARITQGVTRLHRLQEAYGVRIVLEPKLGSRRDPLGLNLLMETSSDELRQWDLSFCLDVGDVWMASKSLQIPYLDMVKHLAPWSRVVHLHHVLDEGDHYYWTPVVEGGNVPIMETLALLDARERDIHVVFEHTPHQVVSRQQVATGISWLRKQVAGSSGHRTP